MKQIDYSKRIDCAAIRCPNGTVWTGHRHHHVIATIIQATNVKSVHPPAYEQGFVTMDSSVPLAERFVDRAKAADIAWEAGQISQRVKELHSEDLY